MVEPQPSKLAMPVRSRSPAPLHWKTAPDLLKRRPELPSGNFRGKAPDVGAPLLRDYPANWLAGRSDLKPRTAALCVSLLLDRHSLPTLGDPNAPPPP